MTTSFHTTLNVTIEVLYILHSIRNYSFCLKPFLAHAAQLPHTGCTNGIVLLVDEKWIKEKMWFKMSEKNITVYNKSVCHQIIGTVEDVTFLNNAVSMSYNCPQFSVELVL